MEQSAFGTSCLGPLAGLEKQRKLYEATVAALSDATRTTMVLVARPEASALAEAARTSAELAALGVRNQRLVVNAVFQARSDDPVALALEQRGRTPRSEPGLGSLVEALAAARRGVILTMGKGGVAKTTTAAAIAVELARRGLRVRLSTTDPVPPRSQETWSRTVTAPSARVLSRSCPSQAPGMRPHADVSDSNANPPHTCRRTLAPTEQEARARLEALIENAARMERVAHRAERCADEWLAIARQVIRDVDEDLARRAGAAPNGSHPASLDRQ